MGEARERVTRLLLLLSKKFYEISLSKYDCSLLNCVWKIIKKIYKENKLQAIFHLRRVREYHIVPYKHLSGQAIAKAAELLLLLLYIPRKLPGSYLIVCYQSNRLLTSIKSVPGNCSGWRKCRSIYSFPLGGGGGYTHLLFPTLKVNHFISAPKTDPRAHQSD